MVAAGVDEAGRGPVIGPMVIAGVSISSIKAKKLKSLGVKDSKMLLPERRKELASIIREESEFYVIKVVEPRKIDEAVSKSKLNLLEAEVMAEIIKELSPSLVFVDSPGRNPKRFKELLRSKLSGLNVRIRAENKADRRFVHVAAASILAKVERDSIIEKLRKEVGYDFGSGYPSDPKTREFLLRVLDGLSVPEDMIRWKWATILNILEEKRRNRITEFLD
ncbi:MAG: ribonuclease HII [Candidatus Korarchaeota archaeon]|nr:ribonuclease HII [Candidatus Korarchaeota archaeon]